MITHLTGIVNHPFGGDRLFVVNTGKNFIPEGQGKPSTKGEYNSSLTIRQCIGGNGCEGSGTGRRKE